MGRTEATGRGRFVGRAAGTRVAALRCMTIKNLILLGGALAGAAYLKDKSRRDRLVGQARGIIDQAKTRATEIAGQVKAKGSEALEAVSHRNGQKDVAANDVNPSSFDRSSFESGSYTYR